MKRKITNKKEAIILLSIFVILDLIENPGLDSRFRGNDIEGSENDKDNVIENIFNMNQNPMSLAKSRK